MAAAPGAEAPLLQRLTVPLTAFKLRVHQQFGSGSRTYDGTPLGLLKSLSVQQANEIVILRDTNARKQPLRDRLQQTIADLVPVLPWG